MRNVFLLVSMLMACNSQAVTKAAQCGDMEQEMFLSCLSTDCSASYQQDLAGTDACTVDGSTSTFSVDAGGSCGFSSSGSCYVICSCDEATEISVDVSESDVDPTECLTTSSPEWVVMADTIQSLSDANTALLSEMDTLKMDVARVSLSRDTLYESVDDLYGSMDTLQDTIDSMDEGTVIVSTYTVNCYDADIPFYDFDGIIRVGCLVISDLDIENMPYYWNVVPDLVDVYSEYSSQQERDCMYGNTYCFGYGETGHTYTTFSDDGNLYYWRYTDEGRLYEDLESENGHFSDLEFNIVIIHDREYFAP